MTDTERAAASGFGGSSRGGGAIQGPRLELLDVARHQTQRDRARALAMAGPLICRVAVPVLVRPCEQHPALVSQTEH